MIEIIDGKQTRGIIQSVVETITTKVDYADGSGVMPALTSTPQNTDGEELMTLTITPREPDSTLYITVALTIVGGAAIATPNTVAALFKNNDAAALEAQYYPIDAQYYRCPLVHSYELSALGEITFKVRGGCLTGAVDTSFHINAFNSGGGAYSPFGGKLISVMRVDELQKIT